MTADLVCLVNFPNKPKHKKNKFTLISWKKKIFCWKKKDAYICPRISPSPTSRKNQIFLMKIVSYKYIKAFFSFYNIFFYTQPAFAFHLLVDFYIIHDHIVAYFFFLFFRKTLISFTNFFVFFLYYLGNI